MLVSKKISQIILLANSGKRVQATEMLEKVLAENRGNGSESRKVNELAAYLLDRIANTRVRDSSYDLTALDYPDKKIGFQQEEKGRESIYIVTPTFNSAATLDETIKSVIYQKGEFVLYYHIQDGGSSDQTLEIIESWHKKCEINKFNCNGIVFTYNSEKDTGMYEAIFNGFSRILPPHDVWMGWINSDDTFLDGTFQFLKDVSSSYSAKVSWVTGIQAVNKGDDIIHMHDIKHASSIIKLGLCDGNHWYFLQQEGTFWRKWVWDKVDLQNQFRKFRYAGDWSLWYHFANCGVILFQARMPLGVFHSRVGQLSQLHFQDYLQEIDSIVSLERREGFARSLMNRKFQVHSLERLHNMDAIVMSSFLVTFLGSKSCFPSLHSVVSLD